MAQPRRWRMAGGLTGCFLLVWSLAHAQETTKKAFALKGKVESVDANARTMTVSHENVEGLMPGMTMSFRVDQPGVLNQVKPGDSITATIYEGNINTLVNVRVVGASAPAGAGDLPPISYVCPTVGEESYVDDRPGRCPKSGEALTPVRLVIAFACLKSQAVPPREKPGRCPIDGTDLVPITAGLYFTCKADRGVREMNPGACGDGTPRIKAWERRPHGDHNPRHGGSMFMAADQWHHLEGTFVAPGVFRVYFYNDMTQSLAVNAISGYVARTNANAEEIGPLVPLKAGNDKDRSTLEARVDAASLPLHLKLRVKFKDDAKDQVFDFTFPAYSQEP